jgi:HEAT repeat protein
MRLDHASMAMWAIPELGAKSREFAVHDLIQRLGNTNEWIMGSAWLTLQKMAPESVNPLCEALTNANPQVRVGAASALGEIRPPALSCVPALQLLLADTNVEVVVEAAESLSKLDCKPDIFIPIVIQTLTKAKLNDPDELFTSLDVLAKYTNESTAAIPVLLKILEQTSHSNDQTNQAIHQQVRDAIRVIDPRAIGSDKSPANDVLPSQTN